MLPLIVYGATDDLHNQLKDFGFDVATRGATSKDTKLTVDDIASVYAIVLVVDHVTPASLCTAVFNLGTIAAFGKPVFVMWRPRNGAEVDFDPSDVVSQAKNVNLSYSMEGLLNALVFSLLSKLEFKRVSSEAPKTSIEIPVETPVVETPVESNNN